MKKGFSVLLVLAALLSFAYRPAFAAVNSMDLIEARNDVGGSVIFVFHYSGDNVTNEDFKGGQVFFGDMLLDLNCNIADPEEKIVQCTTSRAAAGHYVNIIVAGQEFLEVKVVERSGGGGSGGQYCYNVYGIFVDGSAFWSAFDQHCQDAPANYGDQISGYPYPNWSTMNFEFLPQSPGCANNTVIEDAYYDSCGGGIN